MVLCKVTVFILIGNPRWLPVCRLLSQLTFYATSPKPFGQLEPNMAGMFLGWFSTKLLFFVLVGYSTLLPGPIMWSDWLNFQKSCILKLINWLKPNFMNDHWNVLYKVSVFYVDQKSKMAATAGHRFNTGPYGKI
jgi:hypothetical protein